MRYFVAVLGLLLLIAALGGTKYRQIASLIAMGKEMQKAGPPPEAVSTALSQAQTWEGTLRAVGSVAAVKGVDISNDAPGVVSRIAFESGALVRQGQVLVELDARVERAQLASARARQELATLSANRSRALARTNSIAQSQLDGDESGLKGAAADVSQLEAQIDRKTVRAPFSGRLGIRAVNLGQYLSSGTTLTVLEAIDSVYVDFTLPQQRLADVGVGTPVRVNIEGGADSSPHDGTVAAVDPTIDATTRTVRVRADVPNGGERLRPGMFVNVSVVLPQKAPVVVIPATALVHASYGDSVFVVEGKPADGAPPAPPEHGQQKVARQQFVRIGEARGDFVSVVDGVTAGQEVVTAGAFKLHNGAPIVVNDRVKLDPMLAPQPANR